MLLSFSYTAVGDLLHFCRSASALGTGPLLSTVTPYVYTVFKKNPAAIAYNGFAAFSYSQHFPGDTLYELPGRHALGTLTAEFPLFNYCAMGLGYTYSVFSADNYNYSGAPILPGEMGGQQKNIELAGHFAFAFNSYPKRPRGDKLKELLVELKQKKLPERYTQNAEIKRKAFGIPFSLGAGIDYLYYNFQSTISSYKTGSSYHGMLLNAGGSLKLADQLTITTYLNNFHINHKRSYNGITLYIPYNFAFGLTWAGRSDKLYTVAAAGYNITSSLNSYQINGDDNTLYLGGSFIVPVYHIIARQKKPVSALFLSRAGVRYHIQTDMEQNHGGGGSVWAEFGTPLRYLRAEYGFSASTLSYLQHSISISYIFFERP